MKATIEIPDALYRQVKARSALDGRSVRDVTIEAYRHWLAEAPAWYGTSDADAVTVAESWLSAWERLMDEVDAAGEDERTTADVITADRR